MALREMRLKITWEEATAKACLVTVFSKVPYFPFCKVELVL
jgi:hypothetical protein